MNDVLIAPYRTDRNKALELYLKDNSDNVEFAIQRLFEEILYKLEDRGINNTVLNYPSILIPETVLKFNKQIKDFLIKDVKDLLNDKDFTESTARKFIDENHRHIKWSLNEWILLNAGCCIEICHLSKVCSNIVKEQLKSNNIASESLFIHNHVVRPLESEYIISRGVKLGEVGFKKEYFIESRTISAAIIKASNVIEAVVSEGSWIYDPQIYKPWNGKPLVRFDFLADERLVGHRFYVKTLLEGDTQLKFALENSKTRQALYKEGKYIPESWGVIYSKKELLKQF